MPTPEKAYTIGRGKVLFKQDGQNNFADLGNCNDFKFTVKTDQKDHMSKRSGFATKDDSAILQQTANGSLTLDDLMDENMKMFLMGSAINNEVQAAGSVSAQEVLAELAKWVELGKLKLSSVVVVKAADDPDWDNPSIEASTIAFVDGGTGRDSITDSGSGFVTAGFKAGDTIVITGSTSNNSTFVALSVAAGVIEVISGALTTETAGDTVTIDKKYLTGEFVVPIAPNTFRYECTTAGIPGVSEPTFPTTIGATVTDGAAVWTCRKLTYIVNTDYVLDTEVGLIMCLSDGDIPEDQPLLIDYDHAAITATRIDAATAKSIKGHIFFVGDPPKGKIRDVKGYVSLIPNGDLSVIGDDWMNIGLTISFEENDAYAGLYWMRTRGVVTSE